MALALDQHPAGRALWPVLRARAQELLSAREPLAAVQALAAALEQAGALHAEAVEVHVRHLPRSLWALPAAE